MFCDSCGKKLPDDADFCDNCGKKILRVSCTDSTNSVDSDNEVKKTKRKLLSVLIPLIAVVAIASFFVCYLKIIKPKMEFNRLPELSGIERKLNRALRTASADSELEVYGFEISDADEEYYDKEFECEAFNGNVWIFGQEKDGHIIGIQTFVFMNTASLSDTKIEDYTEKTMALSVFPLLLYDDDVNTLSDLNRFIRNMKVYEGVSEYSTRYVKGDIETTINYGKSETTMLFRGSVRYLPAFEEGDSDSGKNTKVY